MPNNHHHGRRGHDRQRQSGFGRRARILGLLLVAAIPTLACLAQRGSGMNVILITADTLRADRLSCYGYPGLSTNAIDRLAEEGVLFEQAVATVPLTLPSHCTIMTGRYPHAHGVRVNGMYSLPEEETTLAEVLRERGYQTAAVIAAFPVSFRFGIAQGFDFFEEKFEQRADPDLEAFSVQERTADRVNEAAFRWLDRRDERPFFLWVHYFDPHKPYAPPLQFARLAPGRPYDGEVAFLDWAVEQLLKRLESNGLLQNTLLVFVGDHGEGLGDHREGEHGVFLYETTIRVPLIVKGPGETLPVGLRVREPVSTVQIAPTVLDLLGLDPLPTFQGKSMLSLIQGADDTPPPLYAETLHPKFEYGWSPLRALRAENWKYIDAPQPELYDLREDPAEETNLAQANSSEASRLKQELDLFVAETTPEDVSEDRARAELDEEALEKLQSLGYLAAGGIRTEPGDELSDPKSLVHHLEIFELAADEASVGNHDRAIRLYRRVLSEDPGSVHAHRLLAKTLVLKEDWDAADAEYRWLLANTEHDPNLLTTYAHLLLVRGDYEKALDHFRLGLDGNAEKDTVLVRMATVLRKLNRLEEAEDALRQAVEFNPRSVEAVGGLAVFYADAGRPADGVPYARKAAELDPGRPFFRILLGRLLLRSGQMDDGVRILEEVLEEHPRRPDALYMLGEAALHRNDREAAERTFERIRELEPDASGTHLRMGRWLSDQGLRDEAAAEFRKALEINPTDERAREALRRIEGSP